MQEKILDMLIQEDEITWQAIILDLVKTGELNPWDVDISILTFKYLDIIKKLKEANLFVSSKVLLASALLLKIKTELVLNEGIAALDYYLFPQEEIEELDGFNDGKKRINLDVEPKLTVKTPMARKRRVTVNDLIGALEKALEVNERRVIRKLRLEEVPEDLKLPDKGIDITSVIKQMHLKIINWFTKKEVLEFTELVVGPGKKEKIYTFMPLLHLANQESVDLDQPEHFGSIYIKLLSKDLNSRVG